MATITLTSGDDIFFFDAVNDIANDELRTETIFGGDSTVVTVTNDGTVDVNVDAVGTGNDSIRGHQGDDVIYGGDGNDTLSSSFAFNFPTVPGSTGGDTVYGGSGDDTITSTNAGGASSYIADTVYGGDGNDSILGNVENPDAVASFDTIYGGTGNDTIDGNTGFDVIYGGSGDDLVLARAGGDTTDGGDGIDTIDFSNDEGAVEFTMADGATTITGLNTVTESNVNYENVIGSAESDTITGSDADNSIAGGASIDTLSGGLGSDTFNTGDGNDIVVGGEDGGDTDVDVLDYSGELSGVVIDYSGDEAGNAAGTGTDNDTFSEIERIIVTDENDQVNATNDTVGVNIDLQGGNDFVAAGQGSDSLDGGAGDDQISYLSATAAVEVDAAAGTATGGSGSDVFANFEEYNLSNNDDSFTGSTNDETVFGEGGNDTIRGSAGADSLSGGAGIDTLSYASDTAGVAVDLSNNSAGGGDAEGDTIGQFENLEGGSAADNLSGSAVSNSIEGNDGGDVLSGNGGDDTLYGGAGGDVLRGDAGNDSIYGGDDADNIVIGDGSGNDSVIGGEGGDDSVIGGEGGDDNDTITVQANDFDIIYSGGNNEAGTINILDTNGTVVQTIEFAEIENIVCFTRGTMIKTPSGEVAIEDLSEGDLVLTRDRGAQPLRWIGSQSVRSEGKLAPVMIKAGALGNDRDLRVSPLHRMLIADWRAELMFDEPEVLAAAKHLVNGDTIYVDENADENVEYFHMLFDGHEIVEANGAWAESFHPGEQGVGWLEEEMREEIFELFPQLRTDIDGYGNAARAALRAFETRALKR